ncbi:hypothetical protein G1C97_1040 [Bifidobacterium sp. DSM 109959]|uniref:DivIVA domain-containing protein n=1 Tax=Bifidobacterium olomucense TaxID=2675324 RepID=A0A7Y0EX84_9BIFI|nr:hypothetical protein [Bifidobacterium sp. DSM 109959]
MRRVVFAARLLTPRDVRCRTFTAYASFFRPDAYDADEVDEFMDEAETTITVLCREILELRRQVACG